MPTVAQKRATLKAYMAGADETTAGALSGMTAEQVSRAFYALDRSERLSISRELLLDELRTVQAEIELTHGRLKAALKQKNRARGSADTAVKNLATSYGILVDKQAVIQKHIDEIEAAMQGTRKKRAKNSLRVRRE